MADWRQIQARIRKARTGPDAPAKLTALYERTRDAMVAFELAKAHEQAGDAATAREWYQVSADRFRRDDWRTRAEEAIARLGGTPAPREEAEARSAPLPPAIGAPDQLLEAAVEPAQETNVQEAAEDQTEGAQVAAPAEVTAAPEAPRKRTRRGRRGGRRRKKGGAAQVPAAPGVAPPSAKPAVERKEPPREQPHPVAPAEGKTTRKAAEWGPIRLPERLEEEEEAPSREPVPRAPQRSRTGDPGLASRLAKLDSMLRRLLADAPHGFNEAETAPAGPGVFLISDRELTTYYYVEQCATLRIAVKMALHGQRGRDREGSVKSRLAEHLEINDSQATKYMKEHCVVRWLQTDEGASHLAHYAVAVLQPALNE